MRHIVAIILNHIRFQLHELAENPSALHNTWEKKMERKQMLAGERPSGCQYCWNVEDLGKDNISDRTHT